VAWPVPFGTLRPHEKHLHSSLLTAHLCAGGDKGIKKGGIVKMEAKTFKDRNGKTGKVGSLVVYRSLAINKDFNAENFKIKHPEKIKTVKSIWRNGAKGTFIEIEEDIAKSANLFVIIE
jgi:hypothetical protein